MTNARLFETERRKLIAELNNIFERYEAAYESRDLESERAFETGHHTLKFIIYQRMWFGLVKILDPDGIHLKPEKLEV